MKKSALMLLIILLPFTAKAQSAYNNEDGKKINKEKLETKDYLPEIHGTIRSKYEYQTTMGAGRFEVRNARVSVTGNVLPIVAYKAEIDLSDEGNIKMLDAYARLFPAKGLTVTAGQMRVPFTIDAHRSPHQQYFANRSFIAKQVGNVRDVGVTLGYTLPTELPITIEGGLYNGSGLTNQKEWHKEINYSAKAQFLFTKGLNLTLSVQSIQPEEIRVQSYDVGAYYEFHRFHIEGEYLYKQYSDNAFGDVQAVNTFINYDLPLRKVFNKMSFLLRYDMMTDQSDAKTTDEETGSLITTDYKRQRLTGGITFSLSKAFRTDLRLNYEKYFYARNSIAKESEQNRTGTDDTILNKIPYIWNKQIDVWQIRLFQASPPQNKTCCIKSSMHTTGKRPPSKKLALILWYCRERIIPAIHFGFTPPYPKGNPYFTYSTWTKTYTKPYAYPVLYAITLHFLCF